MCTNVKKEVFDYRDGKNAFEPCVKCGAELHMGWVSRGGIHIECGECGHKGVAFPYDPLNRTAADKLAFDAWNEEYRLCPNKPVTHWI